MERVKGIEPSYSAWEAAALPLSYTRMAFDLSQSRGGVNHAAWRPATLWRIAQGNTA